MTIPSRVLASGVNSMSTVAICGDGGVGLTATGTNAATAYPINRIYNEFTTVASSTAGAKLPPTEEGMTILISNSGSNTMELYPYDTNSTINGLTKITLKKDHSVLAFAVSKTVWRTLMSAFV
jgi:hypothetical protein